ncbi:MAG: hypothetical protein V3S25_09330 [Nitrospirales bacterium]
MVKDVFRPQEVENLVEALTVTEIPAGCSKRPSSEAAASEEARRTGDPLLFRVQRVNGTLSL